SLPFFHSLFPDAQLTGADISSRSLEVCRTRFPGVPARYLELASDHIPMPDASVDVAFTACVFHHIAADEHARWLRELRRVVRPGGRLMLFEHNPLNPLTAAAVRDCPFDIHAKLIGAGQMRDRIAAAGWRAPRIRYRIFFPHALRGLRPLEQYMAWLPLGAQYSVSAHAG
ncbi:MAG: class I SAM-dependent methyltransferase, partial [Nevskiales bacterium]